MQGLYFFVVGTITTLIFYVMPPESIKATNFVGYATQAYLLLLFIKVIFDDSAHFSDKKKHGENWSHGIGFSMLWTLLMISAIRVSIDSVERAAFYALLANLVGLIWIIQNYLHKEPSAEATEINRHRKWAWVNCINIAILASISTFHDVSETADEGWLFVFLAVLTIFDFIRHGSLARAKQTFT